MASKLIVTRQQLASALHAAFLTFASETSPALGERLTPFLDDEEPGFDFEVLQAALARMIVASLERLVAADKAHEDELAFDALPRSERDQRVKAVRAKLIDIRRIVAGLFGLTRAREIVAVDGATAEQPELLWRQAQDTLDRLRNPDLSLPPASTGAVSFDASLLADELEPLVTALRASVDGCAVDVRDAAVTLQVKKEAMAEHDRLMSACGKILSGLCLLADRPDLARRIRVTPTRNRRPPKRSVDVQDSEGAAPAAQEDSGRLDVVEGDPNEPTTGGALASGSRLEPEATAAGAARPREPASVSERLELRRDRPASGRRRRVAVPQARGTEPRADDGPSRQRPHLRASGVRGDPR